MHVAGSALATVDLSNSSLLRIGCGCFGGCVLLSALDLSRCTELSLGLPCWVEGVCRVPPFGVA